MTYCLDCPNCGDDVFEREHNWYTESDEDICMSCGATLSIGIDCGEAYVRWDDEFEPVGQPRCNGFCDPAEFFIGTPCAWTCERAAQVFGAALVSLSGAGA